MKLTIELDDGKEIVHQNITDMYVAVRKLEPMQSKRGKPAVLPETTSFSFGSNVRELVKEVAQSLVELQDFLRNNVRSSK